jgi:hypothetical protein
LLNTSDGSIIDQSSVWSAWTKLEGKELKWHLINNSHNSIEIHSNQSEGLVWHGGGMSVPSPHIPGYPCQKHIWKLVTAFLKNALLER